jgi:hypothetical protein
MPPYWNLFSVLPGERTLPLLYRWGLWQHHYSFYQFYSGNVFSLSPIIYLLPSDLVICHHGGGSSRVLRCPAQYTNQAQTSLPSPRLKSLLSFFFYPSHHPAFLSVTLLFHHDLFLSASIVQLCPGNSGNLFLLFFKKGKITWFRTYSFPWSLRWPRRAEFLLTLVGSFSK